MMESPQWLLLPGAACGPEVWNLQRGVLPAAHVVSYPDVPEEKPLLEAYADAVVADAPGPLVLVGHSLGGAVAQLCALAHPTRVVAMVLVASAPRLPVNPAVLDGLGGQGAEPTAMLERIARWSLDRSADPRLADACRRMMTAASPGLALRQFRACARFDITAARPARRIPVHVVVGTNDRMTPPPLVESSQAVWAGAVVHRVPDAGHLVMLERPEAVNSILSARTREWR
jgi:pimeloyl-ACP methyl ester carboxylesterase